MPQHLQKRACLRAFWLTVAAPTYAFAHDAGPIAPRQLLSAWPADPIVLALIATLLICYALGVRRRLARRHQPSANSPKVQLFVAGLLALLLALVSPVAVLGETIFAGHMVQHVLLTMVATPLLIAADAGTMMLWAFPLRQRRGLGRAIHALRPGWTAVTQPFVAWTLHIGTLMLWHWPRAYEAAVQSHPLHAIEHASFVLTAIPFWWNLLAPHRRQRMRFGGALLYLFGASLAGALLGALITMARVPWYPVHARGAMLWGLTPLEDQQLAGLVMWIPAGIIYLLVLVPVALPALRQRSTPTAA
jgi:putative membrane protein